MPDRVRVYIDGFNLYFGMKEKHWRRYYWLDPQSLGENLLQADQTLERVKYFTSRISGPPAKRKRQSDYLEAVTTQPLVDVFYGHYLSKQKRCRSCNARWQTHEEKMTDVQIAVQLLQDAYEDRFDTALVISADSDLVPPIRAVRTRFPAIQIVVAFPPKRNSVDLKKAASASFMLGRKKLADSQLPDPYVKPDGFALRRPAHWN